MATLLALNAPALARESPVLLFATDESEASSLSPILSKLSTPPRIISFEAALKLANSSLHVHRFPESIGCLAPLAFNHVNDVLRYSSIWRSIKRAYGARTALTEFRSSHVLVTDSDGYVWKPLDAQAILKHASTIWYADHRGKSSNPDTAAERPPRPDTNHRARLFCSLHPWVAALHPPLPPSSPSGWQQWAARFAIGRSWADWEKVAINELSLLPGPDADFSDDPLLVVEGHSFSKMWNHIESHWRSNFAEAVLIGLLNPSDLYKHCVRGDVLFLELTYKAWLYYHQHSPHHHKQHEQQSGNQPQATTTQYRFQNSTALIESYYPAAARPLGFDYRRSDYHLPSAIDAKWFHPAPSGLSRMWLHATPGDESSSISSSSSAAAANAIKRVYEGEGLVAFRHNFDLQWANATLRGCAIVELIQSRLRGSAAAMQLSGDAPDWLWRECASLRGRRRRL